MAFVKTSNGTVTDFPYSIGQLRKGHPNVSFPKDLSEDTLAGYGVFPVSLMDTPKVNPLTHRVVTDDTPTLVGGVWSLSKSTIPLTAAEVTKRIEGVAAKARSVRDDLLLKSDWTQLVDARADTNTWAIYRQALRDIPQQTGFPNDVVWPIKP